MTISFEFGLSDFSSSFKMVGTGKFSKYLVSEGGKVKKGFSDDSRTYLLVTPCPIKIGDRNFGSPK